MMKKKILGALGIALLSVCAFAVVFGQTQTTEKRSCKAVRENLLSQPLEPVKCELALRFIDDVIDRSQIKSKAEMIVILRLGTNESKKTAKKRREELEKYLLLKGLSKFEITFGGDRVKGFGRMDFYVQGQLIYSLKLDKNQVIYFTRCVGF